MVCSTRQATLSRQADSASCQTVTHNTSIEHSDVTFVFTKCLVCLCVPVHAEYVSYCAAQGYMVIQNSKGYSGMQCGF